MDRPAKRRKCCGRLRSFSTLSMILSVCNKFAYCARGLFIKLMPKQEEDRKVLNYQFKYYKLPWHAKIARQRIIEHPSSIEAFKDWPKHLNDAERVHLAYLEQ